MNAAKLTKSDRLQRTLKVLRDVEGEISTRDLARKARIMAVSATVSELRANGAKISCRQEMKNGCRIFYYSLLKEPKGPK